MKVKWIFFDIDNTLFNTKELALRARKNAIKAMIDMGLQVDDEETAYEKLKRIIKRQGSNSDNHFNELVTSYNAEQPRKIIAAGVVAYHDTKKAYLTPFPDVVQTLLDLSEKGYKLGVISNGLGVKQWEKLIRLGVQHFFKLVIISEEVEIEKPQKGIFEKALNMANCKAGQSIMVGDREDDIAPAKLVGMHSISVNKEIKADYNINNFSEILDILK